MYHRTQSSAARGTSVGWNVLLGSCARYENCFSVQFQAECSYDLEDCVEVRATIPSSSPLKKGKDLIISPFFKGGDYKAKVLRYIGIFSNYRQNVLTGLGALWIIKKDKSTDNPCEKMTARYCIDKELHNPLSI